MSAREPDRPGDMLSRTIGVVGWKNSGKTTLVEDLVTRLANRGLRVATLKHAHHEFEIDVPGKDSYRHRKAGASEVLVASDKRWALIHENNDDRQPDLHALLQKLTPCDIAIAEGFKFGTHNKIEIYRDGTQPLLALQDSSVRLVVAFDVKIPQACSCPVLARDQVDDIVAVILRITGLRAE